MKMESNGKEKRRIRKESTREKDQIRRERTEEKEKERRRRERSEGKETEARGRLGNKARSEQRCGTRLHSLGRPSARTSPHLNRSNSLHSIFGKPFPSPA